MTWLVASLGTDYAFVVSDVRVWSGGAPIQEFGLQKVQRIGERTVVGFAGSVRIGTDMVERLGATIGAERLNQGIPIHALFFPILQQMTEEYPYRYSEKLRMSGCELIVVNMAALSEWGPRASAHLYRFPMPGEFPRVEYKELTGPSPAMHLGAGTDIDHLDRAVSVLNLLDAQSAAKEGEARHAELERLVLSATERLENVLLESEESRASIGPSLWGVLVTRDDVEAFTSGSLPPLVTTWPELRAALTARRAGFDLRTPGRLRVAIEAVRSETTAAFTRKAASPQRRPLDLPSRIFERAYGLPLDAMDPADSSDDPSSVALKSLAASALLESLEEPERTDCCTFLKSHSIDPSAAVRARHQCAEAARTSAEVLRLYRDWLEEQDRTRAARWLPGGTDPIVNAISSAQTLQRRAVAKMIRLGIAPVSADSLFRGVDIAWLDPPIDANRDDINTVFARASVRRFTLTEIQMTAADYERERDSVKRSKPRLSLTGTKWDLHLQVPFEMNFHIDEPTMPYIDLKGSLREVVAWLTGYRSEDLDLAPIE